MDNFELTIRRAFRAHSNAPGSCPTNEQLEDFYAGRPTDVAADQIRDHIASCKSCLEVARDYCAFAGIVGNPEGNVLPFSARVAPYTLRIAAAVLLTIGVGTVWMATHRPENQEIVRSAQADTSIAVVSPKGAVKQTPSVVEWNELKSAESYEVELRDVRLNVLWKQQVHGTRAEIPAAVVQKMARGSDYGWRVTAITKAGRRLGATFTTFSIAAN